MIFALFVFLFRKRGDKMFKDYDKYLSASLKVYLFVLIIVFIMKIVGLDYFGLDINNLTLIKLNDFIIKIKIDYIWYFITMYLYTDIILSISINEYSNKLKLYSLIITIINYFNGYFIKNIINNILFSIILDIGIMCISSYIYTKNKNKIKNTFKIMILMLIYQIISCIIRNNSLNIDYNNFIINLLLNMDYLLMMIITYMIYKGGATICGVVEVYLSSLKKINLKNLQRKLQKNLNNFKKQDKETKLTYIIYFILSLIWNTLSLVIILIVAQLNHTFIECIFILTSFWLSKQTFGKAFHLSSMAQCFVVSNLTYYTLNRITTPLGISILIPIMLGVGLSYFTSKLVKKTYKPLYKGMPKELFEETILKVVDKESDKYKICYDYFINKKSALYLAGKYNYSEAGIRKIKDRVNDKIKELK